MTQHQDRRDVPRPTHGAVITVSVILPMRNSAATAGRQVRALLAQDCMSPWELVVVDNGSTDRSAEVVQDVLRDCWPAGLVDAQIHSYREQFGYASPRNHGIHVSSGEYVAFCDADDEVAPGWLSALLETVSSGHPLAASRVFPVRATDHLPQILAPEPGSHSLPMMFGVGVVHTGGMCCSRNLLEQLGGFDQHFDLGGEDVDLSLRAHALGVEPILASTALYFARGRSSVRSTFQQGYRNGRTQVRLFERHMSQLGLAPSPLGLIQRRLRDLVRRSPSLFAAGRRKGFVASCGVTIGRILWSARLGVRHF